MEILKKYRQKRDLNDCLRWTARLVTLYITFGIDYSKISDFINNILKGDDIPPDLFPEGEYPEDSEADRQQLKKIISSHGEKAEAVLKESAGLEGQAVMDNPSLITIKKGAPLTNPSAIQRIVSHARLGHYKLDEKGLKSLTNEVRILNHNLQPEVFNREYYSRTIVNLAAFNRFLWTTVLSSYVTAINNWITQIGLMRQIANSEDKTRLGLSLNIAIGMQSLLSRLESNPGLVVSAVYHGNHNSVLVGISFGEVSGRVYHPLFGLVEPKSVLQKEGAYYIGALAYLESEVLRYLFANDWIDSAEADVLYRYSANSHDEL